MWSLEVGNVLKIFALRSTLCRGSLLRIFTFTNFLQRPVLWNNYINFFLKKWAKPGLFLFISFFSHDKYSTNLTINDKSIDGVLGTRTRGGRMVGADESTELWRHPNYMNVDHTREHICPSESNCLVTRLGKHILLRITMLWYTAIV